MRIMGARRRYGAFGQGILVLFILAPMPCWSQTETTSFTYDAIGRVVEEESVRNAETIGFEYSYDNADNRTQQVITEQSTAAAETRDAELAHSVIALGFDPAVAQPTDPGRPQE